ncbi:ADP-ribosylglycohydrolase family protein [Pluralibacter sp.]|uniref:ADP-ribosylglycohydrolase family protein n=1 Tax=Pluralibacter sp. TaxID=1920032 RepID=UPI0025E85D41|nr:ADP-ribosylglycohydrolase family protein [Pluralibacter sp.]MBV8043085.1 ADP-ribosylglycohydrolase family protein [Pluralibacter sp.]
MTNSSSTDPLSLQGRIRAMLFGVAYGDAIGATVEKLSAAEIHERYGRVTSIDMEWHRMGQSATARNGRVRGGGIITDDTLMTLCLMSVYNNNKRHIDAWDMAKDMVKEIAWTPRWVPELQREAMLIERLFYPEKWIFQRHQLSSCDPRQGGIGNMVNCGAAMYIAPVGAVNACDPKAAYDEAITFASGHQQSYGLEAAGVLAAAVAAAFVPETTLETVINEAIALAKDGTRQAIIDIVEAAQRLKNAEYATIVEEFHTIIGKYSPMGDDVVHSIHKAGRATDAYCPSRLNTIEELPIALGFAVINEGDFYKTIQDGINSGRDTDSIGVMAGAILGALHGANIIDPAIACQLDRVNKFELITSADTFTETVIAIHGEDYRREVDKITARQHLIGHFN